MNRGGYHSWVKEQQMLHHDLCQRAPVARARAPVWRVRPLGLVGTGERPCGAVPRGRV